MKRFDRAMKMVVAMMSLCLICVLGVTAEAAKYQPGVTYVNPRTSNYKSESEYYSLKKIRMSTYDDYTFTVIYPKDASFAVKTNKKALGATIVSQSNEDLHGVKTSKRVYVSAKVTEYDYYYKDYAKNTTYLLTCDEATKKYYYTEAGEYGYVYDATTDSWNWQQGEDKKIYVTPNYTRPSKATYTDAATGTVYTYDRYNYVPGEEIYWNEDKGFYYNTSCVEYENYQTVTYDDGKADYEYAMATIQLTSTKSGTYKVDVVVNGKKTTMTVYVSTYTDAYKKAKLGSATIYSNSVKKTTKNDTYTTTTNYKVKSSLKSAKLKFTANSGYKITGIVTAYVNKDGKATYKKTKNGAKISLSQAYASTSNSADGSFSRSAKKETFVYVSWKDTKLGTSATYSIVKKGSKKMIKCVEKRADGKKYTTYYERGYNGGYSLYLWSY